MQCQPGRKLNSVYILTSTNVREPGHSVSWQNLYCAFFISRDPGGGVLAHVKGSMGRPWAPCQPGCVYVYVSGFSMRSVLQMDCEVLAVKGWGVKVSH